MMSPSVRDKIILARDELDILSNKISLAGEVIRISLIITDALEEDENESKTGEKASNPGKA